MSLMTLDYGILKPFGETIGKPRTLAWPVNAYRVTLPKQSEYGEIKNPLERFILKIIDASGAMSPNMLSAETCIPIDLVKGILLRLRDKKLVDEHNAITEVADCKLRGDSEVVPEFVTALIFRELVTGKILPFLHFIDESNPLRKLEEEKKNRKVIRKNAAYKNHLPEVRDVITALRFMKKRHSTQGNTDRLPSANLITIVRTPESYFLQCPIAIQKSDGEFRIADPFGNGFSLTLERAFECLLEYDDQMSDWLHQWKESLSNSRPPQTGGQEDQSMQPYNSDANWQRYPKLLAKLRISKEKPFRSISNIHASLEWALFYACSCRSYGDAIAKLRLCRQADHPSLINLAARTLGFECSESSFRPVPIGRLMKFEEGEADLVTILAIAFLQAEKDSFHPLRRIAQSYPNFITSLIGIKKARDAKVHGEGGADAPKTELPDDRFMRDIVHLLLPDISFVDSSSDETDRDTIADSLLDARASIQGEFGFKMYNRLGTNLQDRLIYAEQFWITSMNSGEADASNFVNDLYAALQAVLSRQLIGKLPPDVMDNQLVGTAHTIARDYNFGNLPESITTVSVLAIRQTLQGSSQSLGACIISFLLMADADALNALGDCHPSLVYDVSRIIALRRHGNEPLPMLRKEISEIRKAAYSTIKSLIEI